MVRLLTHNILACHAKDCNTNNFPLEFKDVQLEIREAEFNPEFLKGFLPKLEWKDCDSGERLVMIQCLSTLRGDISSWVIHLCR